MKRINCFVLALIMTLSLFVTVPVQAADAVTNSAVFVKQSASGRCTLASAVMMLRRRAFLEGNENWSSITENSIKSVAWSGGGLKWDFTYAGMRVVYGTFKGMSQTQKEAKLLLLLSEHPEGVIIYMYGDGKKTHAVLATDYDSATGTVYCADPANSIAKGRIPLTSAYLTGSSQDERIGNLRMYWYVKSGNCTLTMPIVTPPVHNHSYSYLNDSAHPHSEYKYCSCGDKEYTGNKKLISTCSACYPVGNVNLTRSFEKTKGTATFYRNNVSNATSYSLKLYCNNSLYNTYNMSSDTYKITGLPSGNYTATLYAKNSSTGEERSDSCESFKIVETYTISYNANGGSNAPSSHEKLQDDNNFTLKTQAPTKVHYIFKGWARSKNATVAEYQSGDAYSRNAKVTLYAVWEPETYTIKFDANGGKGEILDTTITYGDAIRIPNDVICDYSYLKGWSTSKTATTATYKIGMDYKFDANTTLYAVWGTSTWSGGASASLSGSGTEADPYLIQSESDLGYLANKVNSQTTTPTYEYYKLTNNINLAYNEWVPIGLYGNEYQYFYGSFDGNGFTISDLYITKENEKNVGLFGYVKDSEIKNLTVTGAIESITSSNVLNIGTIVGYAENTTLKELNTMYFNIGSISAGTTDYTRMGTIAGYMSGGSVSDCISTDSHIDLKSGKFEAGMIAGYSNADMADCSAIATTGGLFSTQTTVGEFRLGSLCGNLSANAKRCSVYAPYFSNNIKTTAASSVGGLVGYLDGKVTVCSTQFNDEASNSITMSGIGSTEIGGIAGFATSNAKITDCKFDGNSVNSTTTSGSTAVGGLVGTATAKTNPTVSVNGGLSLSKADLPTKDGYKATWYIDAGMTTLYDFSQTVASDMTLYAKWEEGDDAPDIWDGTSKEPAYNANAKTYTITNGEELAWVSDVTNGVITSGTNFPTDITFSGYTIELANDIYLNDTTNWENWDTIPPKNNWKPMGCDTTPFAGRFDGLDHTVYGLFINNEVECDRGLFGCIKNGVVSSIVIKKSMINSVVDNNNFLYHYIGFISGRSYNSEIYGCVNYGRNVKGKQNVGGLIGYAEGSQINECINYGDIKGYGFCGGIVGKFIDSTITYCCNYGYIRTSGSCGGGICGYASGSYIYRSYNAGDIKASYQTGGIVGSIKYGYIRDVHNSGTLKDGTREVAGIIGQMYCSDLNGGYNIGKAYCDTNLGAIVGSAEGTDYNITNIEKFYTIYDARGLNFVGSLGSYAEINHVGVKDSAHFTASPMSLDLSYLSSDLWARSNINNGYPYLNALEETYKTYKIAAIVDTDNSAINRSFANINGNLSGSGSSNANVGGILGSASGSSGASSVAQNVISIADGISSSHKVGNIVANNNGYFIFNNAYYNTEMNVTSSNNSIDSTGTARSEISMNVPFYTNLLGLTPYTSVANVANDNKAVWVLENGKLPELYYNCLNDITISDDIENGSVTIDKTQAVDGEVVTITATPNDGYILNKVYVDGVEQDGTTFVVDGNDEVYVTFAEEIPVFDVSIAANENVNASLVNADAATPMLMSAMALLASNDSSITANDGEEIQVNAVADSDYTVDSIYVNGEEVAGNSFILTEDSVITMDVTSISTDVVATTNDAEDVGDYFAVVSGSVSGEDENAVKYIRYWSADDVDTVYVTEVESGSGDYTTELMDLAAETTYYYQMTERGEIKSFTTCEEPVDEHTGGEDGDSDTEEVQITALTVNDMGIYGLIDIGTLNVPDGAVVYIAAYDTDKKLVSVQPVVLTNGAGQIIVPLDKLEKIKAFVWDKNSTAPLCVYEETPIS